MEVDAPDSLELEVSDFGPIVRAKVDLRPLTVFVGPSNTGKSYLAMLTYALHRFFGTRIFPFRLNPDGTLTIGSPGITALSGEAEEGIAEFVRSVEKAQASPIGGRVALSPSAAGALRSGFAKRADLLAEEISRCFGVNDPSTLVRRGRNTVAHVTIRRHVAGADEPLEHVLTLGHKPKIDVAVPAGTLISVDHEPDANTAGLLDILKSMPEEARNLGGSLKWSILFATALPQGFGPLHLQAYYLPADRTGLMHAHNVVVGGLIANAPTAGARSAVSTPTLSGVVADFLTQLLEVDRFPCDADLGKNIEHAMLGGSIRVERSPNTAYPHFAYRPEGWREDLAVTNSSSMVSEVAPVVLYLRHLVSPDDVLILEEPESHLHPAMQVEFMRQLAAIVNTGVRLIVTTHSEWFTEELTNIVRRSRLPDSERKGPALAADQVGVWVFQPRARPKGSVVKEVPLDEYGYCGTGFDEIASALHNEWANTTDGIEKRP